MICIPMYVCLKPSTQQNSDKKHTRFLHLLCCRKIKWSRRWCFQIPWGLGVTFHVNSKHSLKGGSSTNDSPVHIPCKQCSCSCLDSMTPGEQERNYSISLLPSRWRLWHFLVCEYAGLIWWSFTSCSPFRLYEICDSVWDKIRPMLSRISPRN